MIHIYSKAYGLPDSGIASTRSGSLSPLSLGTFTHNAPLDYVAVEEA